MFSHMVRISKTVVKFVTGKLSYYCGIHIKILERKRERDIYISVIYNYMSIFQSHISVIYYGHIYSSHLIPHISTKSSPHFHEESTPPIQYLNMPKSGSEYPYKKIYGPTQQRVKYMVIYRHLIFLTK